MYPWPHLKFWKSGEFDVIKEKLDDLDERGIVYNPVRSKLFRALSLVSRPRVRVAMIGQDPYPASNFASGVAFSISDSIVKDCFPSSLNNIFDEYQNDLGVQRPWGGDLTRWCKQGVLLWNAYPSCEDGKPGSHHWVEWEELTKEIIEELDEKNVVIFIMLGKKAQAFTKYIQHSDVIEVSHPSSLGVNYGFKGSRIFSTTNALLREYDEPPINWILPHTPLGDAT